MPPDLARELRRLANAVQMLTRVPVPPGPPEADGLARSARWFPLVGGLVGGVSGLVLLGASRLWPEPIPALLAVAAALLLTGALHEDGLADSADSLGGRDRDAMLAIMKDPRLGAFGALALLIVLGLKVAALSALPAGLAALALVAAGAVSRFLPVSVMARTSYAGRRDLAKVDHGIEGPRAGEVAFAALLAALPLMALDLGPALAGLGLVATLGGLAAVRLCRALGGYTGDVLGAVTVLGETAFLLGAAAAWR